jgi:hypothetical protein
MLLLIIAVLLALLLSKLIEGRYASATESPQAPAQPTYKRSVKVFHFLIPHWGDSKQGLQECGDIRCEWMHSEHMKALDDALGVVKRSKDPTQTQTQTQTETVTLAVYNLHSWYERTRSHQPAHCDLQATLTLSESEESRVRYGQLFDSSFKHFDGFSTTHPDSSVQRVYTEAFLDPTTLLPALNFSALIKGASYVASDCHKHDSANANRDGVVALVRAAGFRVDGLGRCMHSATGPEGVALSKSKDTRYSLFLKRQTIGRFLFNFAFENSYEAGYVTEKPFDALIAGESRICIPSSCPSSAPPLPLVCSSSALPPLTSFFPSALCPSLPLRHCTSLPGRRHPPSLTTAPP